MSRQINFFATESDTHVLNEAILSCFKNCKIIKSDNGFIDNPEALPASQIFFSKCLIYIVPEGSVLTFSRNDNDSPRWVLSTYANPVIEYQPSIQLELGKFVCGRIYWEYSGNIDYNIKLSVFRLLRWVRSRTLPDPDDSRFRYFKSMHGMDVTFVYWAGLIKLKHL